MTGPPDFVLICWAQGRFRASQLFIVRGEENAKGFTSITQSPHHHAIVPLQVRQLCDKNVESFIRRELLSGCPIAGSDYQMTVCPQQFCQRGAAGWLWIHHQDRHWFHVNILVNRAGVLSGVGSLAIGIVHQTWIRINPPE